MPIELKTFYLATCDNCGLAFPDVNGSIVFDTKEAAVAAVEADDGDIDDDGAVSCCDCSDEDEKEEDQ